MPYIEPDIIEQARQMDLLTYLQRYEPSELVKINEENYTTKTHDSLKISNGKWCWFSRGIGGKSALDYLVKVKGISFLEAVEQLTDGIAAVPYTSAIKVQKPLERTLLLPRKNANNRKVFHYLQSRGIDAGIIEECIKTGRIYESFPHHNVVFVGFDAGGTPRFASLRGTTSSFKGEATGRDKRHSFSLPAEQRWHSPRTLSAFECPDGLQSKCRALSQTDTVHLFESAIDLLSYATLLKLADKEYRTQNLLSLAGVYKPQKQMAQNKVPVALEEFLRQNPNVCRITFHLDNDAAGRSATEAICLALAEQYETTNAPAPFGKDINEYLCMRLQLPMERPERAAER